MTKPVENDGTWNMYKDIVQQSKELEEDIRRVHVLIAAASQYYEEMCKRYYELPGWLLLHSQISFAFGMPEVLLAVIPDKED